jgi:hypothetical protein
MKFGSADDGFEAFDFFGEDAAAMKSDAVVAAAGVFLGGSARSSTTRPCSISFSRLS